MEYTFPLSKPNELIKCFKDNGLVIIPNIKLDKIIKLQSHLLLFLQ